MESTDINQYIVNARIEAALRKAKMHNIQEETKLMKSQFEDIKKPWLAICDIRRFKTDF